MIKSDIPEPKITADRPGKNPQCSLNTEATTAVRIPAAWSQDINRAPAVPGNPSPELLRRPCTKSNPSVALVVTTLRSGVIVTTIVSVFTLSPGCFFSS